jgi:hypothetical protein
MASTRLQQASAIANANVLLQLTGSLLAAAAQVLAEDPATADHAHRLAYANAILLNPSALASIMLPALMTNATLASAAGGAVGASGTQFTDADIDFVVASVFSTYADQYVAQTVIGAPLRLGA